MTDTCTHDRPRRRSWLATPLAIAIGAVVLSATSAYAAAQITSAQIQDGTIRSVDIKNLGVAGADLAAETVTGAKIRNGTVGAVDLKPGVANRLTAVLTRQWTSADLSNGTLNWQWALPTDKLYTFKVTALQRFTVHGIIGYQPAAAGSWDVAVCSSVNGGPLTSMGSTYGTISSAADQRFNVPVLGETTASGVTLRLGPCLRGQNTGDFIADVSSMTVWMTNP